MNSKSNNRNRDDSPASSSSISPSPYNLRRNQSQPGAVTKRINTTKSKKDISVVVPRTSNRHTNSSISPQLSSGDEEQLHESSDTSNIDCSDDEEEASAFIRRAERDKNKPPSVWIHFDHLDDNVYLCQLCYKSIRTCNNTDANLRSHLGRVHQMFHVMYASQRQQRAPKPNQIKPEKKRELHEAALDCIITDGRSFGDFRRLGMSKFLNVICPGYRGPSRKTVRRRLGLSYHKYRAELRSTLASIPAIAITIDMWTKKRISFICLTGHAFNSKYESIPIVLGFRRLVGPHRANKIKKYILYELRRLEIEDKICAMVSDNGSDIKKAINDIKLGRRFSCIAHDINLVVKNGLKIWETPKIKKKQTARTTTNSFDNNAETSDDARSESDTIDVPEELEGDDDDDPENNPSDNSEDELYGDDGGNNTENYSEYDDDSEGEEVGEDEESENGDEENNGDNLPEPRRIQFFVRRLVKRVRACINYIHWTRAINDYVKDQAQESQPTIKAGLITDLEIRWNTTFIMLDRFSIYRPIIHSVNSQPYKIPYATTAQQIKLGSRKFEFNIDDWSQINDLHTALKPFFIATNVISAKNYPTLATAYSVQYALRHFLSNISENDSMWLKCFKLCLRETFELYFDEKMEQHQKNLSLTIVEGLLGSQCSLIFEKSS